MNLRDLARDRPCLVRLPGCNNDPDSVVLAHYRLAGTCGVGMKPPDTLGAYACSHCHDGIDERINIGITRTELRLAHAEGVMRTLAMLHADGYRMRKG
jgi:hypothetical protein